MEGAAIVLIVIVLAAFVLELLGHINLSIIRFRQNWKEEVGVWLFVILMMSAAVYFLMLRPAQLEREEAREVQTGADTR